MVVGDVIITNWLFFTCSLTLLTDVRTQLPKKEVDLLTEDCECLPFYQCDNDYGVDVIILRKTCAKQTETCCPLDTKTPVNPTTLAPILDNKCGIRNADGLVFKISNGGETFFGEFPWMIALLTEKDGVEHFECGGSLIHYNVVLTAGHCIDKVQMSDLIARGGGWNYKSTQELLPHQNRRVRKIIIHDDYVRETAFYDVALLILKQPFSQANNLGIICLPNPETILYEDCIVTGWGSNEKDGELQDSLRFVEVSIVPRPQCQALLRETRLGKRFKLHESFMCAGGVEADSCEGDGGGPLICPVKDGKDMQYQQVGIVSWGIDCRVAPGVYANIVPLVGWIEQQMKKVGYSPSY